MTPPKVSYRQELRDALNAAGFQSEASTIVGYKFRFCVSHGSHTSVLLGTITGLLLTDGVLRLFVSVPTFFGDPLNCLIYLGGDHRWVVSVKPITPVDTPEMYFGELELL